MKITKANNQHYAKFIESAIYSIILNKNIDIENNCISTQHQQEMLEDANFIVKNYFSQYSNIEYTGRNYSDVADFIADGKYIELKYVAHGNGTYFNTSMNYCSDVLGFINYKEYMLRYGILDFIANTIDIEHDIFGQHNSPLSMKDSKYYRNHFPNDYKNLCKIELECRKQYVYDFFNFIKQNNKIQDFFYHMIGKYSKKDIPDDVIIFNYNTKQMKIIDAKSNKSFSNVKVSGVSIVFDTMKATFAWQNGTGLNNPTIRVFLI